MFFFKKNLPTQESIDQQGNLRQKILGRTLKRFNDHYGKESKATRQELEAVIDEEASKIR